MSDARGDRVPELRPTDPGAETGRGLRIVEATAATWGVTERRIGKTVWAELRAPNSELRAPNSELS
ncbi:ATP-binding protein [Streptomyces sp. NPDC048441]|uniref:ATP-binding protein n=1 Tax=Streptomyces sp. NPDC048441 TaxID=3365552 RepID=UPI003717DE8F